ncbi:hypothetical protein BaRGS_00007109 [Batillaria attramentaria]|uniref:Uncharacterized protein n=1 Tax=Batillaria attramentaria TaxID=370345 RepID=A0ABD0LRK5_9CAEN
MAEQKSGFQQTDPVEVDLDGIEEALKFAEKMLQSDEAGYESIADSATAFPSSTPSDNRHPNWKPQDTSRSPVEVTDLTEEPYDPLREFLRNLPAKPSRYTLYNL